MRRAGTVEPAAADGDGDGTQVRVDDEQVGPLPDGQ